MTEEKKVVLTLQGLAGMGKVLLYGSCNESIDVDARYLMGTEAIEKQPIFWFFANLVVQGKHGHKSKLWRSISIEIIN